MEVILLQFLWEHKWTVLLSLLFGCLFSLLALETLDLQFTALRRAEILKITEEHRICMEDAEKEFDIEFELLASYGKVIANFDEEHIGDGIGFLEISEDNWENYIESLNDSELEIDYSDICTNYNSLAFSLSEISGDSKAKIEGYEYENKDEVEIWYERYSGWMLIPYGNPLGLERADLITITSGYNIVRTINGVKSVHKGVDFVPSQNWFEENVGLTAEESINRAIIPGEVSNFYDEYGALCSYITNDEYRTLYCHCSGFIAENGSTVRYGDPICFMGNTGFSTGTHTHMAVYQKNLLRNWNLVDPTPFFFVQVND